MNTVTLVWPWRSALFLISNTRHLKRESLTLWCLHCKGISLFHWPSRLHRSSTWPVQEEPLSTRCVVVCLVIDGKHIGNVSEKHSNVSCENAWFGFIVISLFVLYQRGVPACQCLASLLPGEGRSRCKRPVVSHEESSRCVSVLLLCWCRGCSYMLLSSTWLWMW